MAKKETVPTQETKEVGFLPPVYALFAEAQKTGNFQEWELASAAECRSDYGDWNREKGTKYLESIYRNPDEFGAFAAMMCKIGAFDFFKGVRTDVKVDWDFFSDFVEVIKGPQRASEREWFLNYLLGQDISPSSFGCNITRELYVKFLPYANTAALRYSIWGDSDPGFQYYGVEAWQAMEHWLKINPNRQEAFEVDSSAFINLNLSLAKRLRDPDKRILQRRNERLWFRQPLWKRFKVAIEKKETWDVVDVKGDAKMVQDLVTLEMSKVRKEFEGLCAEARKESQEDFADNATLIG